jgi:RNA polymerase sigma-70 factor (ECF subfamily)
MEQVREGEECAFAELYRRYNHRLLNFFYGVTRDPQASEDLSHETFARIWHFRRRYAATGSFVSYLFAFARLIGLERRRELKKLWKLGILCPLGENGIDPPAGPAFRPDESAARSELEELIWEAVEKLPEDQRAVFLMRTVQRMSLEDIASALNCPVNTVRSRKLLALKKLRHALKRTLAL